MQSSEMKRRLVLVVIVPLVGIFALVVAAIVICWDEPMDAGYLDADATERLTQRGPASGTAPGPPCQPALLH